MIDQFIVASVALAVALVAIVLLVLTVSERNEARVLATRLKKKLDERPVKIVVYSDDVKENQIASYCELHKFQFIANQIRLKKYLS